MSRQKPGGLSPEVMDKVFRADAKKLPVVVGVATPAGYSLVKITKVIEPGADRRHQAQGAGRAAQADDRGERARIDPHDAYASEIGVEVKKDAIEKRQAQ